jgi:hypothetical protein
MPAHHLVKILALVVVSVGHSIRGWLLVRVPVIREIPWRLPPQIVFTSPHKPSNITQPRPAALNHTLHRLRG